MNEVKKCNTPVYELYDTSYWHAFSDEPSKEDLAEAIETSGEMLAAAVREYVERHPEKLVKLDG